MIDENFIEKPEGKPVKAFRARVKMYGNDVVVVNPMEPRESNRKMIKQKGKSSFYKSEGEKESSYSIHINVDANDPDPVATMQERFAELTKGELKSELKLKVKGKMLFESPKLKLYLNKTTKQVVIQTTLDCSPTVERELLQLQSEMGRVIGANYSEILKVFNSKTEKKEPSVPSDQEIIDRVYRCSHSKRILTFLRRFLAQRKRSGSKSENRLLPGASMPVGLSLQPLKPQRQRALPPCSHGSAAQNIRSSI